MIEYIKSLTFCEILTNLLGAIAVNAVILAMLWMLP